MKGTPWWKPISRAGSVSAGRRNQWSPGHRPSVSVAFAMIDTVSLTAFRVTRACGSTRPCGDHTGKYPSGTRLAFPQLILVLLVCSACVLPCSSEEVVVFACLINEC